MEIQANPGLAGRKAVILGIANGLGCAKGEPLATEGAGITAPPGWVLSRQNASRHGRGWACAYFTTPIALTDGRSISDGAANVVEAGVMLQLEQR